MRDGSKWDGDKCMDRLHSMAVARAFQALLPHTTPWHCRSWGVQLAANCRKCGGRSNTVPFSVSINISTDQWEGKQLKLMYAKGRSVV